MTYLVQDVCSRFSHLIVDTTYPNASFAKIDSVESFGADSMVFVSDARALPNLSSVPAVIVTDAEIAPLIEGDDVCVITVNNVRLAQALIKQQYDDYDTRDSHWGAD